MIVSAFLLVVAVVEAVALGVVAVVVASCRSQPRRAGYVVVACRGRGSGRLAVVVASCPSQNEPKNKEPSHAFKHSRVQWRCPSPQRGLPLGRSKTAIVRPCLIHKFNKERTCLFVKFQNPVVVGKFEIYFMCFVLFCLLYIPFSLSLSFSFFLQGTPHTFKRG